METPEIQSLRKFFSGNVPKRIVLTDLVSYCKCRIELYGSHTRRQ